MEKINAALAAAEQLEVNLGIEVQNRISGEANLQNQIDAVASGYLGAIDFNASSPTPGKNGYYEFSTGGVCAWIAGTPTVKVGDRVSVKYSTPSTYVYTHISVDLTNTDLYNVTVKVPLAAGSYYTDATARAAVPTNIKKLGLKITYAKASGVWVEEQYVGSDLSGWTTDGNWLKLGIVEGDINNRVTDLAGIEKVGGLPGSQGILGSSGGDNYYYTCQGVTPIKGTLLQITVRNSTGSGILKFQAVSITDSSVTILHQFDNITLLAGINTYTINDSYVLPVGTYIGVLLSSSANIYYGNAGSNIVRYPIGVENETVTAASTTSSVNFGVDYVVGTLSTFAKREEITLKADHGYTTGLIQTLNGLSTQGASTSSSAFIQSGHMYARKVISTSTSTIPDILFYSTANASGTFYQLRGTTIINQITTSIITGANTIPVNWEVQTNDYIGIVSTFAFGYQGSGGIGFYDVTISTGNGALFAGTIPLAFYEKTSEGDVIKTLKEVETELLGIVGQANITPKRKMRKINLSGKKIILYGDSISSTDYTWYATAMSGLTSATVYNGGFSGAQTSSLATNSYIQRIYDYNPDLIVCLVGGNDTGAAGSVGTFGAFTNEPTVSQTNIANDYNGTYFIQAVDHIMRKVKAYYYNIRLRANLTGNETEAEKTAKIDALPKPYFVFCTTLAQKRNNSSDSYSQKENWERKRNAVIEACNKNGVHCVDLYNLTGFDMSLEPYWTSPTDQVHNNGIYYMDGLHPNKYGYQVISEIICGDIGIK